MKKLIALVAILLLVIVPVSADEGETAVETTSGGYNITIPESWTMEDVLQYFLDTYGLNSGNFSVTVCCPDTGERCAFNETKYVFAASTYKLPLNMYFYERQAEGVYSNNTAVGNTTLSNAHYLSIVHSNNEYSETMIYMLGNFRQYKQKMLDAYGGLEESEISPLYYQDNYYCTKFMGNTLAYLYEHLDQFGELLGYLKQAMSGRYLQRHAGDVEVAHKYGVFYGEQKQEHDVGILFTEQPVLIAVYTDGYRGIGAEELIARLGKAFINYQTQRTALDRQAAEAAEAAARAEAEAAARAAWEAESEAASEAASEEASEAASEEAQIALESALASEEASEAVSEAASEADAQAEAAQRQTILFAALGAGGVIVLLAAVLLIAKRRKRG